MSILFPLEAQQMRARLNDVYVSDGESILGSTFWVDRSLKQKQSEIFPISPGKYPPMGKTSEGFRSKLWSRFPVCSPDRTTIFGVLGLKLIAGRSGCAFLILLR